MRGVIACAQAPEKSVTTTKLRPEAFEGAERSAIPTKAGPDASQQPEKSVLATDWGPQTTQGPEKSETPTKAPHENSDGGASFAHVAFVQRMPRGRIMSADR